MVLPFSAPGVLFILCTLQELFGFNLRGFERDSQWLSDSR